MKNNLDMLDIVAIVSFVLQLQNNDELQKQTSNDEILKRLHEDVMTAIEDNRKLSAKIMQQNDEIIQLLKGEHNDPKESI